MLSLSFGFSFEDLYKTSSLEKLDAFFLSFLEEYSTDLSHRLKNARLSMPTAMEESDLLLELAPFVEDFIGIFFTIGEEIDSLQKERSHLAPLYRCKRLFIQRQAAKAFSKEEAKTFKGDELEQKISSFLEGDYSDLAFACFVLKALEEKSKFEEFLTIALQYAAWALHQNNPSILFRLPKKITGDCLFPIERKGKLLASPHIVQRKGFDCTTPGVTAQEALDQSHYCILCHKQNKDYCSKGYSTKAKGCPLDQKISEMNSLRTQGYVLGALAVIMIDNPMVAATGNRICNDCEKACIFQKQEAVNIPSIESQTLDSVLNLTWGVEIYSLLSRWNPLNLKSPFPKKYSGYNILIAGMGPAGFTLAHYLLNEGHQVFGIDSLKILPLESHFLSQPIRDWSAFKIPLSQRNVEGFGGVMEYGITARWDKNYLKLVRLLLERRSHFTLFDRIKLGETLDFSQVFDMGFDHIALCLGAGQPNLLSIPHQSIRGVRFAADFLKDLQLKEIVQKESIEQLQIRLPILIVGGGLTAVDTAAEALAYYEFQIEKFLKRTEELGTSAPSLSHEEKEIAEEFLIHGYALRRGDRSFLQEASIIVYRKEIQNSPSYRLNDKELKFALAEGVTFLENARPLEINTDVYGHIKSLSIETPRGIENVLCRTLLIATGTHPNSFLNKESKDLKITGDHVLLSYKDKNKVSYFGDSHPIYEGNVVKAMASAKHGYAYICEELLMDAPTSNSDLLKKFKDFHCSVIK